MNVQVWSGSPQTKECSTFGHRLGTASRLAVILAGGALSVPGTSSAAVTRAWGFPYGYQHDVTTGAGAIDLPGLHRKEREAVSNGTTRAEATRKAINELRLTSGLTWDELGRLFGVSRRSLHFWASGKPLNAENESRLMRLLGVIRFIDRGDARSNRNALLEEGHGERALDLLASGRLEEVRAYLGPGPGRPRFARVPLHEEAQADRRPLQPEALIDAENDPIQRGSGRVRIARAVRAPRRGTTK